MMEEKYIGVNAFTSVLKARQKEFVDSPRAFGKTAFCVLEETINKLQSFPTADVAPVLHAHWVSIGNDMYACSKCHSTEECETPYCAICGAKMNMGV